MSNVLHMRSFARVSRGVAESEESVEAKLAARAIEEKSMREHEVQNKLRREYENGYNTAKKELEAEFEDALLKKSEEFYRILESFEGKLVGYESVFDSLVIKLAVRISEKILKEEIKNHSVIEATINEAVKKVMGANHVHIKISPKDYELINGNGKAAMIERNFDKVKFEVTDKIEEGGCIIETEIGNVDARIQSQIDAIGAQLESAFLKDV